jgi:hypothetical protein
VFLHFLQDLGAQKVELPSVGVGRVHGHDAIAFQVRGVQRQKIDRNTKITVFGMNRWRGALECGFRGGQCGRARGGRLLTRAFDGKFDAFHGPCQPSRMSVFMRIMSSGSTRKCTATRIRPITTNAPKAMNM